MVARELYEQCCRVAFRTIRTVAIFLAGRFQLPLLGSYLPVPSCRARRSWQPRLFMDKAL